jgi:hypothetical protein
MPKSKRTYPPSLKVYFLGDNGVKLIQRVKRAAGKYHMSASSFLLLAVEIGLVRIEDHLNDLGKLKELSPKN